MPTHHQHFLDVTAAKGKPDSERPLSANKPKPSFLSILKQHKARAENEQSATKDPPSQTL